MILEIYKGRHSTCVRIGKLLIKIFKRGLEKNTKKEYFFMKLLYRYGFTPKVYFFFHRIIVREFVNGIYFIDFVKKCKNKKLLIKLLNNLLYLAYILDSLHIEKEEMHRPYKNIVVASDFRLYLIDFERSHFSKNPNNVNQVLQFLIRFLLKYRRVNKNILKIFVDIGREYKKTRNFEKLTKEVNELLEKVL